MGTSPSRGSCSEEGRMGGRDSAILPNSGYWRICRNLKSAKAVPDFLGAAWTFGPGRGPGRPRRITGPNRAMARSVDRVHTEEAECRVTFKSRLHASRSRRGRVVVVAEVGVGVAVADRGRSGRVGSNRIAESVGVGVGVRSWSGRGRCRVAVASGSLSVGFGGKL